MDNARTDAVILEKCLLEERLDEAKGIADILYQRIYRRYEQLMKLKCRYEKKKNMGVVKQAERTLRAALSTLESVGGLSDGIYAHMLNLKKIMQAQQNPQEEQK